VFEKIFLIDFDLRGLWGLFGLDQAQAKQNFEFFRHCARQISALAQARCA
jgi:hypothetical protein